MGKENGAGALNAAQAGFFPEMEGSPGYLRF